MNILVVLNKVPSFYIEVSRENTIKEIKTMLEEYKDYEIKFLINSKNELSVFQTKKYDEMTLESVWKQMKNPSLLLSKSVKEVKERVFTKNKDVDISILSELSYPDLLKTCQTNTYLSTLCKDKNLWRNKLAKDFPLRSKFIWYQGYKDLYNENPRKLYEIINSPSKIVTINERGFPSIKEKFPENIEFFEDEDADKELKILTEKYVEKLKELPLLRGDVVSLEWLEGYRNDGKLMWDGEKFVELNNDIDDYGSVSLVFTFPEFPPTHFLHSIDHNNIVNFTPEKSLEIERNFDPETQTTYVTDKYNKYPIKIKTDTSDLIIKFSNIIPPKNLEYNTKKGFVLTVPYGGGGYGDSEIEVRYIEFPLEWKNLITSITPKNSKTTYKWKGDELEVTILKN